jgi:type IV secretion system protein VirD4
MKKLYFTIVFTVLILPIFYISLCINFDLDIFTSFDVLFRVLNALLNLDSLNSKVYVSLIIALSPLIIFISINILNATKKDYGYARFSSILDVKKMGFNFKDGFCLGIFKRKKLYIKDNLGILVIASPGTGKTSSIVIPNLLTIKHSCIVLDIKGELENKTSKYRSQVLKNDVYVFSPYNQNINNFNFNPFDKDILDSLEFNEILRLVKEVANVLFKDNKNSDPHWNQNARKLFIFFCMYDISKNGYTTFYKVMRYPMMDEDELLDKNYLKKSQKEKEDLKDKYSVLQLFFKQVSNDKSIEELIVDMARGFNRFNEREFKSIVSTFSIKLEVFEDKTIANSTQKMSFSYEELRKKNITLYICVNEKDVVTLSSLIQIIIELIGKNLISKENSIKNERVTFFLDEFTRFKKLDFLLELPSISRSYNIQPIFLTQTEAQIEKNYSSEDLRIISGSCQYKIIFTINDIKTAQNLSNEIGSFTRQKVSSSSPEMKVFGSKNKTLEKYSLLTPQDLQNIPKDELIITVFGNKAKPIKCKANYWFKNRKFRKVIKGY